jgi:Sulfotransferase family
MRLPNFLVIGAPRSGTTMLHYSLGQHPEIFVSPNKETNFFLFDGTDVRPSGIAARDLEIIKHRSVTTLKEYAALFAGATDAQRAIGESSPAYLMCPEVAPRIAARIPEAKLVAILRQPVEQALSLYMVQQGGSVPAEGLAEGFVEALVTEHESSDRRDGLTIVECGLYHRHLAAFFEHFDRRQIKVVLLEELERDSDRFFADLFRFLEVDDGFRPASQRYNETGTARSATIHRMLYGSHRLKSWMRSVLPPPAAYHLARLQHRLRNANLSRSQALPPALRPELTERFYAADIGALEDLLGRDLSIWRQ